MHQQLADAANLSLDFGTPLSEAEPKQPWGQEPEPGPAPGQSAQPPGFDGEARGEPGIHGVPRVRRWDSVTRAVSPGLTGDVVHFVALPDGSVVVEEAEPDGTVAPLADAVEETLQPPYRAEAVRRGLETWAVGASRITVVEVPGLSGDDVELVVNRDGRILRVDGQTTLGRAPALERVGEAQGPEYVVRASRLEGRLFEVEATPL